MLQVLLTVSVLLYYYAHTDIVHVTYAVRVSIFVLVII